MKARTKVGYKRGVNWTVDTNLHDCLLQPHHLLPVVG